MLIKNFKRQIDTEMPDKEAMIWLSEQGYYTLRQEDGFIIFQAGPNRFGFYHPRLGETTNTEYICIEIATLEQAEDLLDAGQQLAPVVLGMMQVMKQVRNRYEN